jgi:two-component system alkaline phosphatase synthesis response regulator PhoP
MNHVLLVAEKNQEHLSLFRFLSSHDFAVNFITGFSEAETFLQNEHPEVILLDTQQKEIACFELCHSIKYNPVLKKSTVFILSNRKDEQSELAAFDAGADDFLSSPISHDVLLRRIAARSGKPKETINIHSNRINAPRISIDRESYTVHVDNKLVHISRKEFELLHLMASSPGKIFRREEIYEKIWKKETKAGDRTIDVHILRLRKKIGDDFIQTQKGVGYRFII